jgi:hypothetical protein
VTNGRGYCRPQNARKVPDAIGREVERIVAVEGTVATGRGR